MALLIACVVVYTLLGLAFLMAWDLNSPADAPKVWDEEGASLSNRSLFGIALHWPLLVGLGRVGRWDWLANRLPDRPSSQRYVRLRQRLSTRPPYRSKV